MYNTYPPSSTVGLSATALPRAGTLKTELSVGSEEEAGRIAKDRMDPSKENNADKMFIEDVSLRVTYMLYTLHFCYPRFVRRSMIISVKILCE